MVVLSFSTSPVGVAGAAEAGAAAGSDGAVSASARKTWLQVLQTTRCPRNSVRTRNVRPHFGHDLSTCCVTTWPCLRLPRKDLSLADSHPFSLPPQADSPQWFATRESAVTPRKSLLIRTGCRNGRSGLLLSTLGRCFLTLQTRAWRIGRNPWATESTLLQLNSTS